MDLWGVVFNLTQDCWYAVCYLCDWRGEPAEAHAYAEPELIAHLGTAAHQERQIRKAEPAP